MATEIIFKGPKAADLLETVQAHFVGVYDLEVCEVADDKDALHQSLGDDGVLLVLAENE